MYEAEPFVRVSCNVIMHGLVTGSMQDDYVPCPGDTLKECERQLLLADWDACRSDKLAPAQRREGACRKDAEAGTYRAKAHYRLRVC